MIRKDQWQTDSVGRWEQREKPSKGQLVRNMWASDNRQGACKLRAYVRGGRAASRSRARPTHLEKRTRRFKCVHLRHELSTLRLRNNPCRQHSRLLLQCRPQ